MTQLTALVTQVVAPSVVSPKAKKVSPAKLQAKNKKEAAKIVTELTALRTELQELSGAPVSPLMTIEQLKAKIEEVKNPVPEVEEVEEVEETTKAKVIPTKAKVIPAKPQGIGAHCISLLKTGMTPKNVLLNTLITFPEAKTSMACIYWYASKIKAGVL